MDEPELKPSVLDRLVVRRTAQGLPEAVQRSYRAADVRAAVRRDLEWLLNSRQPLLRPDLVNALTPSVATFGLPDFTHAVLSNPAERRRLVESIERTIAAFEPRLTSVRVTVLEADADVRSLRFRIDAVLKLEEDGETVSYDSLLELPTRSFAIEGP